jgi:hypothetical protein
MKLVINRCYGGFSLSPAAVKRMAELQGRECHFFTHDLGSTIYQPSTLEAASKAFMFYAFDIANPNEVLECRDWHTLTKDERGAANALYSAHEVSNRPDNRADPNLVRMVEELGDAANGQHAQLSVVEIPDGVEWEIDEYDGIESVHEVHRSWA